MIVVVGTEDTGDGIVFQVRPQPFVDNPFLEIFIVYLEGYINAPEQIAVHPIGANQIDSMLQITAEIVDTAMLQETTDDGAHMNVFRQTRPQCARAAHDQLDLDAIGKGGI